MCYSTRGHIISLEVTTAGQSFGKIYNHITIQIDEYQKSSTEIHPSQEMTPENSFDFNLFTTGSDVEAKEMKFDVGKRKQHKYFWIISLVLFITGPPLWERLGTCLMSYDLCLMNWMVCLRIR